MEGSFQIGVLVHKDTEDPADCNVRINFKLCIMVSGAYMCVFVCLSM